MFEQVVFAGGGNRCWWQAGFWESVAPEIGLKPRVIAGVSAGAATACLLYANDTRTALVHYRDALRRNPRNVCPMNAFRRGRRVFPHEAIYREALRTLLGGEHFDRLPSTAPEIRVPFSRLPRGLGPHGAVALGLVDNVPVGIVDPDGGPTLVLTTRRYPGYADTPVVDGRVYVQPARKVAASSWDYTSRRPTSRGGGRGGRMGSRS